MRFTNIILASATLAALTSPAAQAAEVVYAFSGTIKNSFQFSSPIPEWKFATDKAFSGTLKIDTSLINQSQPIVNDPNYILTRYYGAITGLSVTIETTGGNYVYTSPVAGSHAVGAGTQSFAFNGVDMRWHNYPAAFGGTSQVPVPLSAKVGAYTPHSAFVTLGSSVRPGLLPNANPDVDLVNLHSQLDLPFGFGDARSFDLRFSDPALWPPGQERIDAIVGGEITSFGLAGAVPEPSTWAMMIFGFGMIGGAMRSAKKKQGMLAA